jgi:type IV pilus assembly protein PilW
MVGIAIALVGVAIMMEVLITSQQQAITTGSGNDALSTGAVTLYQLEHDLGQAGYGINNLSLLGCGLTLPNGKTVTLAPVVINPPTTLLPAGDANTDRLIVIYGSSDGEPEGNTVYSVAGAVYTLQAPTAFHQNDYVFGYNGSCATNLVLAQVSAIDGVAGTVTAGSALAGSTALYNMGQTPTIVGYRIKNSAIETCNYLVSNCTANGAQWTQVGGNIVSLRALYGQDTSTAGSMDGTVDTWNQTTPTTSCGWVRAQAVRLAVVARSDKYESKIDATGHRVCDTVTTAAPAWSGSSAAPVVLTANTDWQCYRYQTFENIAPTRNVIWMGNQSGC